MNRFPRSPRVALGARADWLVPAGLMALSLVPTAAGIFRMVQLLGGAQITPADARFFAAPLPVALHVLSAVMFCVLGAFQFSAGLRRRKLGWHRAAGRMLVPCGLVAALSGLWMTQFYPAVDFDGPSLHALRLLAGSAMAWFLFPGIQGELARTVFMGAGWAINLAAAEWSISRERRVSGSSLRA